MIQHNGQMADPANSYTRRLKELTAKGAKKMTPSDHENRDRLEWEAGFYWLPGTGPVVPSDNIEACVKSGAQKARRGKEFSAGVLCEEAVVPVEFAYPKNGKGEVTLDALYGDKEGRFVMRKGVKVMQARIIRVRPMVPTGWKMRFTLSYDETIMSREAVVEAVTQGGAVVGLSDWRPKFGRFVINEVKEGEV